MLRRLFARALTALGLGSVTLQVSVYLPPGYAGDAQQVAEDIARRLAERDEIGPMN